MSSPINSSQWMYASGGFYPYIINQSLRFDDGDAPTLSKEYSTAQTNTKKLTISVWVKRGNLGLRSTILFTKSGSAGKLSFQTTDKIYFNAFNTGYNGFESDARFRDVSAWYHIVAQADSADQTGANVNRVYVNGVELSNNKTSTFVPDDTATKLLANSITTYIGDDTDGTYHFDGYLAEMHVVDGSIVAPASFAETKDNIWIPKEYTGSHGNNGFYLPFDDSSAIGDDESANTNDFTVANGLVASDVLLDSPTNNFAVGNSLSSTSNNTFTEGNLKVTGNGVNYYNYLSSMAMETGGKYYFEVYSNRRDSSYWAVGICKPEVFVHGMSVYNTVGSMALQQGKQVYYLNSEVDSATNRYNSTAYLFSFAIDLDNNLFHFRADGGTWENSGDPAAGSGGYAIASAMQGVTLIPWFGPNGANYQVLNFGQDSSFANNKTSGSASAADGNGKGDFFYAPPSGFLALCSSNLPELTIGPDQTTQADDYFNTVLYTGNNGNLDVTGVGFDPDFIWAKNRASSSYHQELYDTVRGDNLRIFSSQTDVEATGFLTFETDGFSLTQGGGINTNNNAHVAWNWKAGGSSNTFNIDGTCHSDASAASLDGGNLTPTGASINTTAGISIIGYTGNGTGASGQTIKHGLSSPPELMFIKDRVANSNNSQFNASSSLAGDTYAYLSTTAAFVSSALFVPTSGDNTTVTLGIGANAGIRNTTNESGDAYIMYLFHSVEGYQKIGLYEGNGSSNGAFVFTGFRPAFLLAKSIDSTSSWYLFDNKREGYNPDNDSLLANTAGAETTTDMVDLLSNGFKLRRGADPNIAETFVYLAIADQPFKFANAR